MWFKKEFKSLIRFHSANKMDNYNSRGGAGWEGEREGKKIRKKLQNKSKHQNNKCFSWVTAVRMLSLTKSHSPPYLPRMPSNIVLISGPAVWAAQILIWSYSCVFLPPMSTAIRASAFSFVRAVNALFIFHRHRVCLVDRMDLIWSLYCSGGKVLGLLP